MRRWKDWPKKFSEKANSSSGIFAIGTAGIGALGLGLSAPVVAGVGAVATAGILGWCAIRALPPSLREVSDALGERLTNLAELEKFSTLPRRVGFLGASQVGKTTLLTRVLLEQAPGNVRTDNPYAVVSALNGRPTKYFALMDGAGQQFSQQFKIADESECLVVCLDHAEGDKDIEVNNDRLNLHVDFLQQLHWHLKNSGKMPHTIHFLLNKRDLWERSDRRANVETWFGAQVALWKPQLGLQVTSSHHSNFYADDTTMFIQTLRDFLK